MVMTARIINRVDTIARSRCNGSARACWTHSLDVSGIYSGTPWASGKIPSNRADLKAFVVAGLSSG